MLHCTYVTTLLPEGVAPGPTGLYVNRITVGSPHSPQHGKEGRGSRGTPSSPTESEELNATHSILGTLTYQDPPGVADCTPGGRVLVPVAPG